jgi:hypothetical protein
MCCQFASGMTFARCDLFGNGFCMSFAIVDTSLAMFASGSMIV